MAAEVPAIASILQEAKGGSVVMTEKEVTSQPRQFLVVTFSKMTHSTSTYISLTGTRNEAEKCHLCF